jgi:hypothetical protein
LKQFKKIKKRKNKMSNQFELGPADDTSEEDLDKPRIPVAQSQAANALELIMLFREAQPERYWGPTEKLRPVKTAIDLGRVARKVA